MQMKKGIFGVAVTLAAAGLGLWSGIDASANFNVWGTGADALTNAPQGVYLGSGTASDYFTINSTVANASGSNAAQLVSAGSPDGSGKNSAIQISKANVKQSWGSIWSKQQSFDLNKSETASMWIYASGENSYSVGDGMTFVLQNGGTDVYSGAGQSMGAWGVPDSLFAKGNPASSAIQNSWALEFDTFPNKDIPKQPSYGPLDFMKAFPSSNWDFSGKNPSSFDVNGDGNNPTAQTGIVDTHIASNYPGDSNSYTETEVPYARGQKKLSATIQPMYGDYYYYSLKHKGFLDEGATGGGGNLSDHRWHHITVDYTPPTTSGGEGSMTYTYNDKNPDTGVPIESTDYATVPIDLSKFHLAEGQSKIRWGFTGSTGDSTENNLVIFDQLPGQAQTEASASLSVNPTPGDPNSKYTEVEDKDSVPGNTAFKLTYTFGRTDGDEDWKAVNGNLVIPEGLNVTSGTITYPDASYKDNNNNKVDVSKIQNGTGTAANQQTLAVPLANNGLTMSGTQHATVTLTGTTKDLATDTKGVNQPSQTSYFTGSNATSSAKTPDFTITPKVNDKLSMDTFKTNGVLKVNFGGTQSAHVYGTAMPTDVTAVSSDDITIHPSINGKAFPPVPLSEMPLKLPTWPYPYPYYFDYEIKNKDLTQPGDNIISFYATYGSGTTEVTSTTVNATVTAGTVGFGHTSGDMTFKPTTLMGLGTKVIDRDSAWSLNVENSLVDQSTWQVTANTAGMFAKDTAVSTPLDGSLFYTDSSGKETTLNESASPIIATGESDGTDSSTNIAKNWTDDTGIRLKVNSGAVEGVYQGTIDWSFINSVKTTG